MASKDDQFTADFLFGNPMAAIDVETTGSDPSIHEIVQISIVPLTVHLEVPRVSEPLHFYSTLSPLHPETADKDAMRVNGLSLDELLKWAPVPSVVLRGIVDWWETLPMGHGRRLTPLAHNWAYERSFLVPFFGPKLFDQLFHPFGRCTMQMAMMINDKSVVMGYDRPFRMIGLEAMCNHFGIKNQQAHNAYHDAVATAELYRNILTT
jgi:DNA polymerase III epsilon subunit-like protein